MIFSYCQFIWDTLYIQTESISVKREQPLFRTDCFGSRKNLKISFVLLRVTKSSGEAFWVGRMHLPLIMEAKHYGMKTDKSLHLHNTPGGRNHWRESMG